MYQIEKNVPMPNKAPGASSKYPFSGMSVGDSFVVPDGTQQTRLCSAAAWFSKRNPGFKFSTRKQPDGSVRIWRIA